MGLQSLFSQDVKCERCQTLVKKKSRVLFDPTHQNRYKGTKSMSLCPHCASQQFRESLTSFGNRLVVIEPIPKFNALVTYHTEDMLRLGNSVGMKKENEEFFHDIHELLPSSEARCVECGHPATMTWCPSEIINRDPFTWKINKEFSSKTSSLCSTCLSRRMDSRLSELDIKIEFILPPIKGEGVMCSWEM
jgi:hypothetical protein